MARRSQATDRAKAKAQREKKMLIGLAVVFVALLAIEGPKTLKLLHGKPNAPIVAPTSSTTTPASAVAAPAPVTSPVAVSTPSGQLVSAVQPTVDPGQLREFSRFASKDPFAAQVNPSPSSPATGSTGSAPKTPTPPVAPPAAPPAIPPAPPAPPPTAAVISLNGELMSVSVNTDFPTAGTVFGRVGSLFHLVALTATTAKVTIVGGSYADGAPALALKVGKSVTLQNTADGTRYTLVLEPQGTQVPAPTATTSTPTSTTPSVVPSSP